jgi:hypothetical protein
VTKSRKGENYPTNNKKNKANSNVHILRRNYILKHVFEGKIERKLEVTVREGRRSKQLLDDFKKNRGYWKMKRNH